MDDEPYVLPLPISRRPLRTLAVLSFAMAIASIYLFLNHVYFLSGVAALLLLVMIAVILSNGDTSVLGAFFPIPQISPPFSNYLPIEKGTTE